MVHYNILDKILDKIRKIIGYEKFDDTKFLIDTDNKLPDGVILKKCYDMNYMCYKKWWYI